MKANKESCILLALPCFRVEESINGMERVGGSLCIMPLLVCTQHLSAFHSLSDIAIEHRLDHLFGLIAFSTLITSLGSQCGQEQSFPRRYDAD